MTANEQDRTDIPHTPFAMRVIRSLTVWTVLLPAAIFLTILFAIFASLWVDGYITNALAAREEGRIYSNLAIGMDLGEVELLFNRPPDYVCRLESLSVHYFFPPGFDIDVYTENSDLPRHISMAKDAPLIYRAKQILADEDSKVIAYSWNDEDSTVHTIHGDYPGYAISELPVEFFEDQME
jgi:hypothetical protein